MPRLWIVHRDARIRTALARLAAAPHDALVGAPGDPLFAGGESPEVVLLGLAPPFEAELEFAHREQARLGSAAWLLISERGELAGARRLFDAIDAEVLAYPPEPALLRRRVRELARRAGALPLPLSLSQRGMRDAIAGRFSRWFGDIELPALLRALDPKLADIPLLVRGEPGSGRGSLARYVHAFGGGAAGPFVQVACTSDLSSSGLRDAIAAAAREAAAGATAALCLLDVDALALGVQRELLDWIEFGAPAGLLRARHVRWIATAGEMRGSDALLDPALRRALGVLMLDIPPLRERAASIPALVEATARRFCGAHGERARGFDADALRVLVEYPWPGNLRELEAVVTQSLAASAADPLTPADLELDGEPLAPVDAETLGAEIIELGEPLQEEPRFSDGELAAEAIFEPEPAPEPAVPELARPLAPGRPPLQVVPDSHPAPDVAPVLHGVDPVALRPLAAALAHELRSPLTGIKTFAQLLGERWSDAEFRARFAARTGEDVRRIEGSLERLERVAGFGPPEIAPVDVTALLAELLEARRDLIRERRLLVLQELDTQYPAARGDAEQLRFALDALLDACFALVPERGDVYLASKHHPAGPRSGASLRVLVRFHGPARGAPATRIAGVSPLENSLALMLAERVVRAQQGSFTINEGQGDETLIVIELQA